MKIIELVDKPSSMQEADLTIIKLSLFSSLKDLESWISQVDLSKVGTIILITDISYGGDMTQIGKYIHGQSYTTEDAQLLYDYIHGLTIEDPPYTDENGYGVSTEEFEENLKNASIPWNDLKKRDDGTTC